MNLAVDLKGIVKKFGSVVALDDVSLQVESGSIHAIVGENGAGKTTLMRVLYGAWKPDAGIVSVDGSEVRFRNSAQAIDAGIGMVSQHYAVIPDLTNLQNLMLGAEPGMVIDRAAAESRADELAARMGFEFDWSAPSSSLSPGGAQKLEILKLLWRNARIMILDEPTAMLSPADSDALFVSLKALADAGNTILLVTHRLPEVMDHCRRVTVLRGGKHVADRNVADTTPEELAKLIVGEALEAPPPLIPAPAGQVILNCVALTVRGDRGEDAVKSADLQIREREVVGIAGVDGSGQRELMQAIMGVRRVASGKLVIDQRDGTTMSTAQRLQAGLRSIPEDRHEEAVIEEWSLDENSALGLQRTARLSTGGKVLLSSRTQWAQRIADRYRTKHGSLSHPMKSLSGGNQQRFVAARATESDPKLILAFQPARGLDLKATSDIYRGIRDRCAEGASALIVSFDLDELLEHCDRIVVMNRGVLSEPPPHLSRDRAAIGRLMVGAA